MAKPRPIDIFGTPNIQGIRNRKVILDLIPSVQAFLLGHECKSEFLSYSLIKVSIRVASLSLVIGIGVGASVIALLVVSMLNLGAKKVEVFDDYPVPSAETLTNYTKIQVAELQKQVCGDRAPVFDVTSLDETDPNLLEWLPQKITFVYLESTETLFRQGCSIDDNGIQYEHFIISNNMSIAVANPRALFQSLKPVQAALEYLMYFSIVQTSKDTLSVISSEQDFEFMTAGCEIERIPPSKNIRVTNEPEYYVIELNVYDAVSGGLYHQDWKVPIDSSHDAIALNSFKIGQCSRQISSDS